MLIKAARPDGDFESVFNKGVVRSLLCPHYLHWGLMSSPVVQHGRDTVAPWKQRKFLMSGSEIKIDGEHNCKLPVTISIACTTAKERLRPTLPFLQWVNPKSSLVTGYDSPKNSQSNAQARTRGPYDQATCTPPCFTAQKSRTSDCICAGGELTQQANNMVVDRQTFSHANCWKENTSKNDKPQQVLASQVALDAIHTVL